MNKLYGCLKGLWGTLKRPSAKYSLLTLLVVGFFSGIIFWGGFHTGLEATNNLEFCVSCHEMRDNVYEEYKATLHYKNKFGVPATCPDCHVAKAFGPKMYRKMEASLELWSSIVGTIDTPEKFEANRLRLATREWARMKDSNSRECRNCHHFESMDFKNQKPRAQLKHAQAQKEGKTCIDCHKGIAHLLPKDYVDPEWE